MATTYYVAPSGADTNAGTSAGAPFATIGQAASVMADGDICFVAPGTYRESVNIVAPSSGIKRLAFIGDPDAANFPGIYPGQVLLDGSDDGVAPARNVGVVAPDKVVLTWRHIDVARFTTEGIHLESQQGENTVEDCRIMSCQYGVRLYNNYAVAVVRRVEVVDATYAIGIFSGSWQSIEATDCTFRSCTNGINVASSSRAYVARVVHFGTSGTGTTLLVGSGTLCAEDVVSANARAYYCTNLGSHAILRRVTAVGGDYGAYQAGNSSTDGTESLYVSDSLFAQNVNGVYVSTTHPYVFLNRCGFLDVTTNITNADDNRSQWGTVTDANGNVLLPDFTPVGAQILLSEEENPIEGLRSARIEVPRVAYYKFRVAVGGANAIVLKAKKSHASGTTVKFRVDGDPNKVVTLADTDQVQTVQLGPVADQGPRFVDLELWAQQVDYIPGHYVLVDSIQVI